MNFYVSINLAGLPIDKLPPSEFNMAFEKIPVGQDILVAGDDCDTEGYVCFRDGRNFKGRLKKWPEGIILEFNDFVPGISLNDQPEWYEMLKDRIVEAWAAENYGPGQGISVAEHLSCGSAEAIIRHQQALWGRNGELVYTVKISAKGLKALDDARALHQKILNGGSFY